MGALFKLRQHFAVLSGYGDKALLPRHRSSQSHRLGFLWSRSEPPTRSPGRSLLRRPPLTSIVVIEGVSSLAGVSTRRSSYSSRVVCG